MNVRETAEVVTAVTQVIYRYGLLMDQGRWDDLVLLFTEDAVLVRPSAPHVPISGRRAILAAFQARVPRLTRHIFSNVLVDTVGADAAHSFCVVSLYSGGSLGDGAPFSAAPVIGEYQDSLVRTVDGWRFSGRNGSLVSHKG